MKKSIIIAIAICFSFILLIILMNYTKGEIKNITFEEYNNLINNKEDFILIIGKEECSYCKDYLETLNVVIKNYDVTFNYLDTSLLSIDEQKKLNKYRIGGTPTTIFIVDGEEKTIHNRIDGTADYDYIVNRLISTGYIKEG
ncbi:MAG: thioredoxin family protein [Bacilli bacterium]|nr:thioredoxin family protein [Bacilli bacterium]MDD4607939.1 thioredoxin family protein [Bacilli bacterium]